MRPPFLNSSDNLNFHSFAFCLRHCEHFPHDAVIQRSLPSLGCSGRPPFFLFGRYFGFGISFGYRHILRIVISIPASGSGDLLVGVAVQKEHRKMIEKARAAVGRLYTLAGSSRCYLCTSTSKSSSLLRGRAGARGSASTI